MEVDFPVISTNKILNRTPSELLTQSGEGSAKLLAQISGEKNSLTLTMLKVPLFNYLISVPENKARLDATVCMYFLCSGRSKGAPKG